MLLFLMPMVLTIGYRVLEFKICLFSILAPMGEIIGYFIQIIFVLVPMIKIMGL